jgi:DNA-binding response OmpR family regulator
MLRRFLPQRRQKASAPMIYSILVVSDDVPASNQVCQLLTEKGYLVYCAHTITEAIDILKTIPIPHLLIGDFERPHTDGIEFLRRARTRIGKSTLPPVLFLVDAKEDEIAARAVGAQELLAKPVDPELLATCVGKLVSSVKAVVSR